MTILGQNPHCTFPDHEKRRQPFKQLLAVEMYREQQDNPDGSRTVTDSVTVVTKRTTYMQDWPACNSGQTNEKQEFQMLLWGLCGGLPWSV